MSALLLAATAAVAGIAIAGARAAGTEAQADETGATLATGDSAGSVFGAEADARVEKFDPDSNFGAGYLRVDGGSDPAVESYLRFAVTDLSEPVSGATLRVYATSGSIDGPAVYAADNGWSETGLTWTNRPARPGSAIADTGPVLAGQWIDYDVSDVVRGNGTHTFVLATDDFDGVDLRSREVGPAPELVISTVADTQPPSAPAGLQETSATETRISMSWTSSADNVGVAGYDLYLNGRKVATTTATSHTFLDLACGSSYTIAVEARDAAGNHSPRASEVAATARCPDAAPSNDRVFSPDADARVTEAAPSTNYGSSDLLRVDGGTDPAVQTYLRFSISGLTRTVTSAKLRLYATSPTLDGPAVYPTATNWSEDSIAWDNRPGPFGAPSEDESLILSATWAEFDVTPLVAGNGTYAFVLTTTSIDGVNMSSREGTAAPELVVSTADVSAPTAPSSLAATTVTASTVGLAWLPSTDDVGVSGYNVFVDGSKNGDTPLPTYTASSLTCGETHTFAVESYDEDGNVSPRTTLSATTAACPPPPCSQTLSEGGDLSEFVAALTPGDVGCLRGGTYTDGTIVSWRVDGRASARITLTEYPGEQAELVGTTFDIVGDYLTVRDLTIRDVHTLDYDGLAVGGTGDRVEHNVIERTARHGILLHTSSRGVVVTRNFIADTGLNSANTYPDHGIYVQGVGGSITSNVFARMKGYGIHVYGVADSQPSNYVIAENTAFGSREKGGILIDTIGGDIRVINNVSAGNASYGIINRRCDGAGCVVDTNLVYGNGSGGVSGSASNTIASDPLFVDGANLNFRLLGASPAIRAGRSEYAYADLDGRGRVWPPDVGAFEFSVP